MFDSIKNIFKIVIILFLTTIISYITYFRVSSIKHTVKILENDLNKNFIEVTKNSILKPYKDIVNKVNSNTLVDLKNDPEFIKFAKSIIDNTMNLSMIKFSIYNKKGEKIITNNDYDVINLNTKTKSLSYAESLILKINNLFFSSDLTLKDVNKENIIYSNIISNAAYRINNEVKKSPVLQIFAPISVQDLPTIDLIIECYIDINEIWNSASIFCVIITLLAIFPPIILYIVLNIIGTKVQKLIEAQHDQNLELTEAKIKAEQESNEKSKFLANVSHELRTPLNAIIGFSEIIKTEAMGAIGVPQYKDYINDINNSGTHLLSLINDILDYSKAEAEKLEVDAVEVDLTKTMIMSMRFVQPRAEEAKVKLIEDFPKEHIVLVADPKRIKQVLLNILSNAVKFTPEGGSVTLSAGVEIEKKQLFIRIKDTGIGMAEKDIPKAMATFGQVDNKLSRKYEGTGLGLPLTKKLVELMKGTFNIQSELGFGTTVTITFEYNPEPAAAQS
ncbi:MAG: sensor histidine kinase [Alphaproteobacteria bacterium]